DDLVTGVQPCALPISRSCRASMLSASPMASLPPGPARVLPGPGTTGITRALLGHSRKPPARYRGRQDFELLPAAVAGLTGRRGCSEERRVGGGSGARA